MSGCGTIWQRTVRKVTTGGPLRRGQDHVWTLTEIAATPGIRPLMAPLCVNGGVEGVAVVVLNHAVLAWLRAVTGAGSRRLWGPGSLSGRWAAAGVLCGLAVPGSDLSEASALGFEPAALELVAAPACPPGAASCLARRSRFWSATSCR